MIVNCDSASTIHQCKNHIHHERTNHINFKLHFIRVEVSKGAVAMSKVHTDNNLVDILIKVVPIAKFRSSLDLVGLSDL